VQEFSAVYRVLRQLAARQLRRGGGNTLDTTGLVHEVWLKLEPEEREFESRGHFLAIAATAMRQILVDHARKRHAKKRGGAAAMISSALENASVTPDLDNLLAIDAALTKLEALDERLARVVEWRFFAGLDESEIASALDVDVRTVRRAFRKARAFILDELRQPP
jgi:RNA polymerase sigma factor (TIGR02999 family)